MGSERPPLFVCCFSVDHIVDQMESRRERYGISYYVVADRNTEMAAPIVAHLAGV